MTINNPTLFPTQLRIRGFLLAVSIEVVVFVLLFLIQPSSLATNIVRYATFVLLAGVGLFGVRRQQTKFLAQGILLFVAVSVLATIFLLVVGM